jgi:hypothetical protein
MAALLLYLDVLTLVAAQLTREEAGIKLAPLCKAGRDFVRDGDKKYHAGDPDSPEPFREGRPMWNVDRILQRIERHASERLRLLFPAVEDADDSESSGSDEVNSELSWESYEDNSEVGSDDSYDSYVSVHDEIWPERHRTNWLRATAQMIDFCRAAGFVELVFDRAAACDGKPCSLLGCHTLRVIDPREFLRSMQIEKIEGFGETFQFGAYNGEYVACLQNLRAVTTAKGTRAVVTILLALGLRPRQARFPKHAGVHPKEPLWHRQYVAGPVFPAKF